MTTIATQVPYAPAKRFNQRRDRPKQRFEQRLAHASTGDGQKEIGRRSRRTIRIEALDERVGGNETVEHFRSEQRF